MSMLIGDIVRRQADRIPDRIYQVFGNKKYSFKDINLSANKFANALLASGISPGDHIGIFSFTCIEYIIIYWGAAKAGVVLAHFNARLTDAELANLIKHSDIKLLIFNQDLGQTVRKAKSLSGNRGNITYVSIGPKAGLRTQALDDMLASGDTAEPDAKNDSLIITENSPFTMIYTSGTTGAPKGVLLSHKQRLSVGMQHALLAKGLFNRLLSAMPPFHHAGQGYTMVAPALLGYTCYQFAHLDTDLFLKTIEREKITAICLVPTSIKKLVESPLLDRADLSSLQLILYGAEPILPEVLQALRKVCPNAQVRQTYGQTEMGVVITLDNESHQVRPQSIGRANIFSDVRILGDDGQEVQRGQTGEIVIKNPSLMTGYYKDPEATREFFKAGKDWGCTGDLGFMDKEAFITLAGRKKDMYISGGENVYPLEIEHTICRHPHVAEAAVIGIPHHKWGEVGMACVVTKPNVEITENDLIRYCQKRLARYKCPKYVKFYNALP
ncbi:class I adenylate-forming enzyme family protein, partial [Thermodesulfobacteriota bacterium]